LIFLAPYQHPRSEEISKMKNKLIYQATDPTQPAWWCYLYGCADVTFFIIYPMIRLLYPELAIYSVWCHDHYYLITAPKSWSMERVRNTHLQNSDPRNLTRDVNGVVVWDIINFNIVPHYY